MKKVFKLKTLKSNFLDLVQLSLCDIKKIEFPKGKNFSKLFYAQHNFVKFSKLNKKDENSSLPYLQKLYCVNIFPQNFISI